MYVFTCINCQCSIKKIKFMFSLYKQLSLKFNVLFHSSISVHTFPPYYAGINGDPSLSLFTYRSFQSFDTFFEPGFSAEFDPLFPTEALELQALELCGEQDAFCLFDIAVTGRLSVGNATKRAGRLWEQTTLLTQPGMNMYSYRVNHCIFNHMHMLLIFDLCY